MKDTVDTVVLPQKQWLESMKKDLAQVYKAFEDNDNIKKDESLLFFCARVFQEEYEFFYPLFQAEKYRRSTEPSFFVLLKDVFPIGFRDFFVVLEAFFNQAILFSIKDSNILKQNLKGIVIAHENKEKNKDKEIFQNLFFNFIKKITYSSSYSKERILALLKIFVEFGVDLNAVATNQEDRTALHLAADARHDGLVSALLQAGSQVVTRASGKLEPVTDRNNLTPIMLVMRHYSFEYGREEKKNIVKYILNQITEKESIKYIVNFPDSKGVTAAHMAAEYGDLDLFTFLHKKGADINCVSTSYLGEKEWVWLKAIQNIQNKGCQAIMKYLMDCGSKIQKEEQDNILNGNRDEAENTALHIMVKKRNVAAVEWLLKNKADPNIRNSAGKTALHLAFEDYNKVLIEKLLDNGASLKCVNKKGYTPLMLAIRNFNYYSDEKQEALKKILCSIISRIKNKKQIALEKNNVLALPATDVLALPANGSFNKEKEEKPAHCTSDEPRVIQDIIDIINDIDPETGNGLLHIFAKDKDMLIFLKEHGADVNILNKERKAPRNLVQEKDITKILEPPASDKANGANLFKKQKNWSQGMLWSLVKGILAIPKLVLKTGMFCITYVLKSLVQAILALIRLPYWAYQGTVGYLRNKPTSTSDTKPIMQVATP